MSEVTPVVILFSLTVHRLVESAYEGYIQEKACQIARREDGDGHQHYAMKQGLGMISEQVTMESSVYPPTSCSFIVVLWSQWLVECLSVLDLEKGCQ